MDIKLVLVGIGILAFFWLITRPARKRRAGDATDRRRRKAHNSRMVHYRGFDTSHEHESGKRRVHAKERAGAHDCSDQCPYCARGAEYQAQLRVFDDRLIRGRKDRRRMYRGDVDDDDE